MSLSSLDNFEIGAKISPNIWPLDIGNKLQAVVRINGIPIYGYPSCVLKVTWTANDKSLISNLQESSTIIYNIIVSSPYDLIPC